MRNLTKKVLIAGLSLTTILAMGCRPADMEDDVAVNTTETVEETEDSQTETQDVTEGTEEESEETPTLSTDIDNVHAKITLSFVSDGMNYSTSYDGVIDEVNQKQHFDIETVTDSMTITGEIYTDMTNDKCYLSMLGSDWEEMDGGSTYVNYMAAIERINSGENVEKISDNQYEIKLTEQELVVMNDEPIDEADYSDEYSAVVTVEDGYITEIDYSLENLDENIDDYQVTVLLSDYNNAGTVELPY